MNKLSKIFQPMSVIPKDAVVKKNDITSKSQKLMLDLGLIKPCGSGSFHIMPLLQRSLERLIKIIDSNMEQIDAQKITMPHLTAADLWRKTGRFSTVAAELLTTKDRHEKLQILSPTHEESITALMATLSPLSYRQFPLRLYQIGTKFRDELKPRFGLMRAKEFIMKDCYSFDVGKKESQATYREFQKVYRNIFDKIDVPYMTVQGDTGMMGGSISHEYHISTPIGEDVLLHCQNCDVAVNSELCTTTTNVCRDCGSENIIHRQGIEIGHTFLLDDKYSKILGATYINQSGKPEPLMMGCYGIGVTRLIAASVESMCTEMELRWPLAIAPFVVCIIPPKGGSKEEQHVAPLTTEIYNDCLNLSNGQLKDLILIDDRNQLTIGKRILEAKRFGYPLIIVIGQKATQLNPLFELHLTEQGNNLDVCRSDLLLEISRHVNGKL